MMLARQLCPLTQRLGVPLCAHLSRARGPGEDDPRAPPVQPPQMSLISVFASTNPHVGPPGYSQSPVLGFPGP